MKLPNLNLLSIPPSPVRAMGGSPVDTREVRYDSSHTPLVGKVRIVPKALVTRGRTCQPGTVLAAGVGPVVEAVEVLLTAVREVPGTITNINDNYCVTDPVLTTRSMNVVLLKNPQTVNIHSDVNCSVASLVPFITNSVRQPQKKGLSPLSKNKEMNSVNCVSFVGHCVSVAPVPNARNVVHAPLVGGRLQPFWQTWARLGANPRVVSILKEGYVLPFKVKPPLVRHPLIVSGYANPNRNKFLREAVQSLVDKKAIEMVRTIRISLQGEWVTSLDFSDAYFHIPIHAGSRKFLRFHFQNQSFQFRALPFGLSTAPMEFTCVVKEVKLMAQSRGIRIHQYLDDWLIRAPTKESCHQGTQSLLSLCQELGWVVNLQKSELEPKQVFEFVGYRYDLSQGLVKPTQNHWGHFYRRFNPF